MESARTFLAKFKNFNKIIKAVDGLELEIALTQAFSNRPGAVNNQFKLQYLNDEFNELVDIETHELFECPELLNVKILHITNELSTETEINFTIEPIEQLAEELNENVMNQWYVSFLQILFFLITQ